VTVLDASTASLEAAAALLAAGQVVGVPTDTVYGLAAHLDDDAAVERLFACKRRPSSVPIAVLCATTADAVGVAATWPRGADRLAERFWPGPLTIVVDAPPALATRLGATSGVGVRVPDDVLCRSLLARTGPLAVTSANLHGAPPATTAADALGIGTGIAAVLDGGTREGAVSTVVDVTADPPVVVREGAIPGPDVLWVLSGG
jgi:tRNA threonylcarbamoyl adenosine modification protein (Sua5/YciO/YrdC/YwlC family)